MTLPQKTGPDIQRLFALFPSESYLHAYEEIPAKQVPQPYSDLLVHEHHMTVRVEAHHGDLVDVVVLDKHLDNDHYARKILLRLQKSRQIVQFGLVRINFKYCTQQVRDEIVSERTPLGRVLIQHNVMRRIEPTAFLRIKPGPEMMQCFNLDQPRDAYGRLAIIHCDEQPAIELLEVVTPQ